MLDETKCDAVMIGRACLGNPWIIKQTVDYLEHGIEPVEPINKRKNTNDKKTFKIFIKNQR